MIAVAAVIASRALVVYGLTWLANQIRRWRRGGIIRLSYQHVLFWGGLRGAVGFALVLSLPAEFAERDLLRVMTFGVVLFTLLGQGTTMQLLLSKLQLIKRNATELEYERRHGRLMAVRAARGRLQRLFDEGTISAATFEQLAPQVDQQIERNLEAQQTLISAQPSLQAEELDDARREGLRAERAMLATLLSDGVISEGIYGELVGEVDAKLEDARELEEERISSAN